MKNILFLLLIFSIANAQEKLVNTFIFEGKPITYTTHYFKDNIYPVNKFYLLINQDEATIKCHQNKYVRPFYLNIPDNIPEEKYEQLFLEFYSEIAERTKLINSEMYVIADKKYSALYRKTKEKQDQSDGVLMNKIEGEYIGISKDEICRMLK